MVRVLITVVLSLTVSLSVLFNNQFQVIRKRVYSKMYNLMAVPFLGLFLSLLQQLKLEIRMVT